MHPPPPPPPSPSPVPLPSSSPVATGSPSPLPSGSPISSPSPFPSSPPSTNSRISWLGKQWFLYGVNLPWYNYANDFGHGDLSVSNPTNYNAIVNEIQPALASGMHVIRWWTWAGSVNDGNMLIDSSGLPTQVNPSVYADFDAALQLANQYDLYYVFNILDDDDSSRFNPTYDTALANALAPLFARYSGNPHILAWEVFNEAEYKIWNGSMTLSTAQDVVKKVASSIHANSTAYATTGSANPDWAGAWSGLGLDFVMPHWYAGISTYSPWVYTASQVQAADNTTMPIGIGEFAGNNNEGSPDAITRWNDLYDGGYIGGWPWSIWGGDGYTIDYSAATTFSQQHSDLGPK